MLAIWVGVPLRGMGGRVSAAYDELTGRPHAARRTSPWLRSMRGEREELARKGEGISGVERSLDELGLSQYLSSRLGEVDTTLHDAAATLGHDIEIHVDSEVSREAHPKVGGQAEHGDHLDGTNSLALRCFGRHCLTVTGARVGHYRVVPGGEPRLSQRL